MTTERQKDRLRTFPIRVQWFVNEYAGGFSILGVINFDGHLCDMV